MIEDIIEDLAGSVYREIVRIGDFLKCSPF
jgi:hypothetical protein